MSENNHGGLPSSEIELKEENLDELVAERLPKIEILINSFIENYERDFGIKLSIIESAGLILCHSYYLAVFKHIKPTVRKRINRYKMCSVHELVTIKHQIIEHSDPKTRRKLNAEFALYSGQSLINSMISHDKDDEHGFYIDSAQINTAVERNIKRLLRNHRRWLRIKTLDDLPVFVNAHFHEAIGILASASYEKI